MSLRKIVAAACLTIAAVFGTVTSANAAPTVPSPCFEGEGSCDITPLDGQLTYEQWLLFCVGGPIINQEKGMNMPLPADCDR